MRDSKTFDGKTFNKVTKPNLSKKEATDFKNMLKGGDYFYIRVVKEKDGWHVYIKNK